MASLPDPTEEELYQQMVTRRVEQRAIWKDGSINPPKGKLNLKKLFSVIGAFVGLLIALYFLSRWV